MWGPHGFPFPPHSTIKANCTASLTRGCCLDSKAVRIHASALFSICNHSKQCRPPSRQLP